MTSGKNACLFLARAGMEMSWRYAWVGFLMLLICHQIFPLAETAGAFVTAIILNRLSADHKWRLYQSLLLEGASLVLFSLLVLYRLRYGAFSFFSFNWLSILFQDPMARPHRYMLLLILSCLLLIWRGGRTLVRNPMNYDHVCIQFDKGIGLFVLLLLVKFLIQEKAGILVDGLALGFLVCAFFIFSLLSIYLARKQPDVEKSFMTGYHGIGITLSLTSLMVFFGSGVTFFFYPILTQVADSLQVLLKDAAGPMVPVLVAIILFFFAPRKMRDEIGEVTGSLSDMNGFSAAPVGRWEALLLKSISLGVIVIVGIIAAILFGLLIRYLLGLLLKQNTQNSSQMTLSWIRNLARWFTLLPVRVWRAVISMLKNTESAAAVYTGLLGWGRRSGVRLLSGETPAEYGDRLMRHFPGLNDEIVWIIDAFNREIYGQMTTDRDILLRLRWAQRRMKRLRYWPSRIHNWGRS
jgi:hypothetical protein